MNIAPDVLKLFDQNLTSNDGASIMVAANVCYQITDPLKAITQVQELNNNLGDAFRRHLAKRVRDRDWEWLVANQSDLERSTKNTMTTAVRDWGVEVSDVGFVCFVKTRSISLAQL